MRLARWTALVPLAFATMCGGSTATGETSTTGPTTTTDIACPDGIAAAFAFWVGNWNYTVPGYDPGTNTVTASSGGCALQEEFVDIKGNKAHTTIQYDAAGKQWKRVVTDPFRTYASTGTFAADGSISFYETVSERETYRPTDKDHVHFIGESSKDGGKTWAVTFDATDTRKP